MWICQFLFENYRKCGILTIECVRRMLCLVQYYKAWKNAKKIAKRGWQIEKGVIYYASLEGSPSKESARIIETKRFWEKSWKTFENLLTNEMRCAILSKLPLIGNELLEYRNQSAWKKFKKLLKNPLTNEKECAIIIRLSQRAAVWKNLVLENWTTRRICTKQKDMHNILVRTKLVQFLL